MDFIIRISVWTPNFGQRTLPNQTILIDEADISLSVEEVVQWLLEVFGRVHVVEGIFCEDRLDTDISVYER